MRIYGAGIAGLLAGCAWPTADIFEAAPEHTINHKALLRFRSAAVGDAVGIEFRKVRVHKGIWFEGDFVQPTIQMANFYSRKVIGKLADRSIWNLDPVDRYVAPEDFIEQLMDRCHKRIHWNAPVTQSMFDDNMADGGPTISTLPMWLTAKMAGLDNPDIVFQSAPIKVKRFRVPGANVFQTIYFPSLSTHLYRASITGDLLIAEYAEDCDYASDNPGCWLGAFGLSPSHLEPLETTKQHFGKIAPIDDAWRKRTIFDLSTELQVYSLGRFGTWRNILLDDVIKDISVIKKLMTASHYDRAQHAAT